MISNSVEPTDSLLRLGKVKEVTGLSKPTIYREMNAGRFPKNVKITEHASGWFASDINAWLKSLRDDAAA